jgi:group II intron reverse transcriptase/maturase
MEQIVARENLKRALQRVKQNKGSPGIDGMTVSDLPAYLKGHWVAIRAQLLAGTYQPQPVKRRAIPKPGGGERLLGIPTVLDRFIQQAILQVLQPQFDPTFSEHSYGFRPGRCAQDAILAAQRYLQEGRRWVVDIDLEKFFDRVSHDVLMGKMAKRIADKGLLRLIRRYLEAGVLVNGVVIERHEGTPQGGPLSPLLANVLLDDVDKGLEKRGHAFCRYADDCNVYVRSRRAGERVMVALKQHYAQLKLRINEDKTAVAEPWGRPFLGYTFWRNRKGETRRAVAGKAIEAMKTRVRHITRRNGGRSREATVDALRVFLIGWREYFRLVETRSSLDKLDQWIRRRLRAMQLKQWKRGTTVYRELRARGIPARRAQQAAAHATRWWRTAAHVVLQEALPTRYYDQLGIPRLAG